MSSRRWRAVLWAGLVSLAFFAVVSRAVLSLPAEAEGLNAAMRDAAAGAGIGNVVTAVLLDVRGYDTLLEVAVLMLATVTVLSLREPRTGRRLSPEGAPPVLRALTRVLVPLAVVVAVHLTWIGSAQPGGAFQAGAVLGAAGILVALSGFGRAEWVSARTTRAILAVGLLAFVAVALLPVASGGVLLQYPEGSRKTLILVVESLLMLSVGASLAILFLASASRTTGGEE